MHDDAAGIGPTKPDAGVIVANPAMVPVTKPTSEGLPNFFHSMTIQTSEAAEAERCVTMGSQFGVQLLGVVATLAWSAIVSLLIIKITQAVCGLRVSEDETIEGLDFTSHGEKGYHF